MRVVRKHRSLLALVALVATLALPSPTLAQSAGDEQYTDPFSQEDPAAQQQEPAAEQPAEQPSSPAAPAPGGNGTADAAPTEAAPTSEAAPTAEAAQEGSATLPRTGAPVVLFAAIGYGLLLAGIAIRRKA
jgi:hypothetical protein